MKYLFIIPFAVSITQAQMTTDSTTIATDSIHFKYHALVIPAALIGYGVIGLESDQLKSFNTQIRDEVTEDIDEKITIDDFSQYAPMAAVYGLNAFGIKGKHNFKDRTIIMATSYLMMSSTVLGLKSITQVERPDGSSFNSFPSGHTATAFAGAEFLWQEYKDVSPWYGISGYAVATCTGLFRMYNNRHWLSDVVTGAGIGILSTKVSYWIYPWVKDQLFGGKQTNTTAAIAPFYNGRQMGCSIAIQF